jgi:hypothetical protein
VSTFKNLFSSLLNLIGSGKKVKESAIARFTYTVQCIGPDGKEKWSETFQNLVTTAGKTDIIDKYFKASGYTAAWYLGLAGAGTKAVGDTLASHAVFLRATTSTIVPGRYLVEAQVTQGGQVRTFIGAIIEVVNGAKPA